jgi:hypothetical protein
MAGERHPDANASILGHRYVRKLEQGGNVKLGFGLFLSAVLLGVLSLLLIVWSYNFDPYTQTSQYYGWIQPGYAMAMLALPLALLSIVVLLPPPKRLYFALSFVGKLVVLASLVGFLYAYPYDWYHYGEDYTLPVLLVYSIGVGLISIATAAALWEHAADLIRAVTQINQPGTDVGQEHGGGNSGLATTLIGAVTEIGSADSSSGFGEPDTGTPVNQSNTGTAISQSGAGPDLGGTDLSGGGYSDGATTNTRHIPISQGEDQEETIVTLVINGDRYHFADGETFGRRPGPWLDDLRLACDGEKELAYLSSEHVKFAEEGEDVFVADLSQNGTKLDGIDLDGDMEELSDGDTLILADRAKIRV